MKSYIETSDGVREVSIDEYIQSDQSNRQVALTCYEGGGRLSTVFLGLDHSFSDDDAPVLYETMAFDVQGIPDEEQRRYHTRAEAVAGHCEFKAIAAKAGAKVAAQ